MNRPTEPSHEPEPAPVTSGSYPHSLDTATLDLLESWRREDATEDPEEVHAAERELAEFKRAMNENRSADGEPLLYP